MPLAVNGKAAAVIGAGALFVYSGLRGFSVLKAVQNVITGQGPNTGQTSTPLNSGTVQTATGPGAANPSAGAWTHAGLMTLWQSQGGSAATANNAACHAIQESSGNASVTSPNPDGGTNVGLWQLDTKGKGAGYTVPELQNPQTNARLAVIGSNNGTDWSAWSTPGC